MTTLAELAADLEAVTWQDARTFTTACRKHGPPCRAKAHQFTRNIYLSCDTEKTLTEAEFVGKATPVPERAVQEAEAGMLADGAIPSPDSSVEDATAPASGERRAGAATTAKTSQPEENSRVAPAEGAVKRGTGGRVPLGQNGRQGQAQLPARHAAADDILKRVPPQNLEAEQAIFGSIFIDNETLNVALKFISAESFYREVHRELFRACVALHSRAVPIEVVTLGQELRTRGLFEAIGGNGYIAEVSASVPTARHMEYYAGIVRDMAIKRQIASQATMLASLAYDGVTVPALVGEVERILKPLAAPTIVESLAIPWEGFNSALAANEAYLKRVAVVDRLCFSSSVAMITGGKHAGKSTLARWMAICVSKGWPFLGREVSQGPVFYVASEDETMAARQELIRLGWSEDDPLRFLSAQNIPYENLDEFLARLTDEIRSAGAVMCVLDMLFDFVRIPDEMSYAGTREAVGKIQQVASGSEALIVVTHHAPKNAMIGDAAVAALGSQGLAARVSPIVLVRRFGPGVHSISSTTVRDPRGEPILESRLVKNDDGSVVLGGAFKNYMLAEVYTERVIELLESEEGSEYTASDVAENLDISYQVASKCLSLLAKQGVVGRTGSGKKGKPYRYAKIVVDISRSNGERGNAISMAGRGDAINMNDEKPTPHPNAQGAFGYKED